MDAGYSHDQSHGDQQPTNSKVSHRSDILTPCSDTLLKSERLGMYPCRLKVSLLLFECRYIIIIVSIICSSIYSRHMLLTTLYIFYSCVSYNIILLLQSNLGLTTIRRTILIFELSALLIVINL